MRLISLLFLTVIILCGITVLVLRLPKFGARPSGERLERIKRSPNYRNGAFRNQSLTPQLTVDKNRFAVMYDFIFGKKERNRPDEAMKAVKSDLKHIPSQENVLVWFGHSSYYIQLDDKKILIDPVFEEAAPFGFLNRPFAGTDLYSAEDIPDIDYLIITHDHWDHLDHKTVVKMKDRTAHVICPLGVGAHFERWGFPETRIIEMDWQETFTEDRRFIIACLPTRHFSGRSFKRDQTLWASFMLHFPSMTIYLSGDGGYDKHYKQIAKQFPTIDLAIMENGQYNTNWRYIHLMPDDLVQAISDLHSSAVITGHHSKYALAKHNWDEPLNNIQKEAEERQMNLISPVIGEIVNISK